MIQAAQALLDRVLTYPDLLEDEHQAEPTQQRLPHISLKEANLAAMKLAKKDPNFVNLTAREWAKRISEDTGMSCSPGTVHKTAFWAATMARTKRGRSEGAKPKAVGLTDKVKQTVGKNDEALMAAQGETSSTDDALRKLIQEQSDDFEDSPLDPNGKPVKYRKRM
jgi:hypothetical protein